MSHARGHVSLPDSTPTLPHLKAFYIRIYIRVARRSKWVRWTLTYHVLNTRSIPFKNILPFLAPVLAFAHFRSHTRARTLHVYFRARTRSIPRIHSRTYPAHILYTLLTVRWALVTKDAHARSYTRYSIHAYIYNLTYLGNDHVMIS